MSLPTSATDHTSPAALVLLSILAAPWGILIAAITNPALREHVFLILPVALLTLPFIAAFVLHVPRYLRSPARD